MLKFYTPDRKGKIEPYSYRSRARLVGKCIDNIAQSFKNDIVVLVRIHTEKDYESIRNNALKIITSALSAFNPLADSNFDYMQWSNLLLSFLENDSLVFDNIRY